MAGGAPRERYRVRDLEVDVDGATIRRAGKRIVMPPRTFELLVALVRRYPDTVRRHDLLQAVWVDEHVTDQTLSHRVMVLRRALGDCASEPAYVASERGFGYRIGVPVERLAADADAPLVASERRRRGATAVVVALCALALALEGHWGAGPDGLVGVAVRPSLGVVGPMQPVADEIARSIRSELGRFRSLRVVGGNDVGATARLRIEGAGSGSAGAMELRLRLVDTGMGRPVWTRVLRGDATEVLGQGEAIAAAAVEAVRQHLGLPQVAAAEMPPQLRRLCQRGELGWLTWTPRGLRAAAAAWEKAVEVDPDCAFAHAGWSLTESTAALLGYRSPQQAEPRARASARRAGEIDPALPAGQIAAALVRLLFDLDPGGAELLARRAAERDPDNPRSAIVLALVLHAQGRLEDGLRLLAQAATEDPYAAGVLFMEAQNLQMAGRWREAATVYEQALALEPDLTLARQRRAECLTAADQPAEALLALGEGAGEEAPEAALRHAWHRRCLGARVGPEAVLRACLSSGHPSLADAALGAGLEQRWPFVVFVPHDAFTAPLRELSGYRALLTRLGSDPSLTPRFHKPSQMRDLQRQGWSLPLQPAWRS
jgi:DNA-binding winged helix-turn-helix (wHTH) protein/tetratricopeptide (TPR) repeat protein